MAPRSLVTGLLMKAMVSTAHEECREGWLGLNQTTQKEPNTCVNQSECVAHDVIWAPNLI
jgi:hypothetical protein